MRLSPIVAALLACQPAAAQGFTLKEALSAPFSNQLTAAPAKARVAWFTDAEGRRNVWVAGSTEPARQVTHYTEDDGQDIDNLAWSADAEQIAWTRGTGAQGPEHPVANPAALPGPVHQNVEVADLRTGTVRVVAEGHTPLFLPDHRSLLFLRRGNIWIAGLALNADSVSPASKIDLDRNPGRGNGEHDATTENQGSTGETAPTTENSTVHQLLYARGTQSNLRLSPDGAQLAFVSHRGDHSFIGLYTLRTRELRWLDPGTGLDHDPVWSADGKRIAFIREVPIVSPIAERWMREGAPWSIRVAETSTGEGRELWHADAGPGSLFHGVSAHDQLLWMRDGRLIFPWEKGGWTRLYALPISRQATSLQDDLPAKRNLPAAPLLAASPERVGSAKAPLPVLLTPGDFEVDTVTTDGSRIVYSSNQSTVFGGNGDGNASSDLDRRHLWVINALASAPVEAATVGVSLETEPAPLSDGQMACMQGSTRRPFVPVLLRSAVPAVMLKPLAPQLIPASFPAMQLSEPQPILFPAADGLQIHGQLFLPPNHKAGERLPAVVFFHGGSRRQMLLGFHPMQYYAQAYEFNQYLASRGFAVLSVNYRSGTGYGLNFRQALHYGADGASEYNDVLGAANYLASRPDIDPKRIGAWGGSYGGYLTALALARGSDRFAAGVDLHGVHDWSLELDLWKPTDDPSTLNSADASQSQAAIARRAFAASPMADVGRWRSPVLLIQGDDDRNVLFSQTVRLSAALRAQGVPVEEKVFPDELHDFLLHRNWVEAYRLAAAFLERSLKP